MAFRFSEEWTDSEESESIGLEYDFESEMHSYNEFQSGRVTVGDHQEEAESKRVSVAFSKEFNPDGPVPTIFCQAEGELGQTYPDVFGCTVVEVRHDGFEVNVGRCGNCKSWGQQVGLNYIAIISIGHPTMTVMQHDVGPNHDATAVHAEVRFPMPLARGAMPFIMATCVGDDHPDAFAVTLKKLTRRGATFNVSRTKDYGDGWGQNVRLNICYFAQGVFPCIRVHVGNSDDNSMVLENDAVDYGTSFRRRPLPFVMAQYQNDHDPSWGDCYCVTVANVQRESCQLNVMRADDENGWGQQARAVICLIP